jgi:hypothetical protein
VVLLRGVEKTSDQKKAFERVAAQTTMVRVSYATYASNGARLCGRAPKQQLPTLNVQV